MRSRNARLRLRGKCTEVTRVNLKIVAAMQETDIELQRRILESVEEALNWPSHDRSARLVAQFGGDPRLLAEIQSLLNIAVDGDELLPTALPLTQAAAIDFPFDSVALESQDRVRADRSVVADEIEEGPGGPRAR